MGRLSLSVQTRRLISVNFVEGELVLDANDIEFAGIHELVDRLVCQPELLDRMLNWVTDNVSDDEQDAAGVALGGFWAASPASWPSRASRRGYELQS